MTHINNHKQVHLIGIGGCSMNGLAQLLSDRGLKVQGSDVTDSPFTDRLIELGIPVFIGHRPENIGSSDLIIYSAAIKPDNPERRAAREAGIPELERSVALGQLSEGYKSVVGIAGCHGKTTITSMLALISLTGGPDATVHVGGYEEFLGGGTRVGSKDLFITEACEYVESFLTLRPTIALIHNIDDDHLDYFKDIDAITDAFRKFVNKLPEDGLFIGCTDDEHVIKLLGEFKGRKLTYGMHGGDCRPQNIEFDDSGSASYDFTYKGEKLARITLHVPGTHNVMNSLAAMAVALELKSDIKKAAEALSRYRLAKRRFEFYGKTPEGAMLYHDFAHHPGEIRAIIETANRVKRNRLIAVLQCNSYTRAKTLFLKDPSCLAGADEVLTVDIYPGREKDDGTVHAGDMVNAFVNAGIDARYTPTFEDVRDYLKTTAKPGDLVLTLGSGDVYKQTKKLL
ncbi:MAG: UDP-N-acetylmuramate--L-alanine ligase [Firmicutes bacterium ADurb.Bin182]|nr:MAG: UDP-N-acetylmuramate--L-alanine ligase [Firmicutes bacterium ADurb.Bin182]